MSLTMEIIEQKSAPASSEPVLGTQLRNRIEKTFKPRWDGLWGGKFVLHGRPAGTNSVRLDGNDYLSLTGHPDIVRAHVSSLTRNNEQVIQSGVYLLDQHPARAFEHAMAQWIGKADGFLCQSGYAANMGLLQAIADRETPVYLDAMAHASLWEGARAAGAPSFPFRHNDTNHLERTMAQHGPGVVVVDAIYSTTGAVCPLHEMVEVAERFGSMILVDESHSLGTHGPDGAGLCAQLGLTQRVHFITASLAKAFAGRAGFFTAPEELRYFILSESFPNIFSSCLLPHEIAALAATLRVVQQSQEARLRLHANSRRLRGQLEAMGYPVHHGTEQIIALEVGTEPATMMVRDGLEDRGVFGSIFCAPATSRNRALVRLTLNAALTDAELTHVEEAARDLAQEVHPWEWPAARRAVTAGKRVSRECV